MGRPQSQRQREAARAANTTHGMSRSPTYNSWANMRQRCGNPKHPDYHNYGARGIRVCERWADSFENFLADMGERPEGMTLERSDTDGHYEPGNCCWATMQAQMHNIRRNLWITYKGEQMILADWSRRLGVDAGTLRREFLKNGSLDQSIEGRNIDVHSCTD